MTEISVKDEGGNVIKMLDFGEYRSSKFGRSLDYIKEVNRALPELKFRDEDVLIASYPKAGCTWTYEILTMLLRHSLEGPKGSKMDAMLEACQQNHLESLSSPRLLNTHMPYRRIPSDFPKKNVKTVFVVRNPKDVAVSLYNMMYGMKHYNYSGTFHNWLPLFIRGDLAYDDYCRYIMDWEAAYRSNKHNILLVYFEDLKQDSFNEIKKISTFLDLNYDDDFIRSVSDKCQFDQMKLRYTEESLGSSQYREGSNFGFMRKGKVADWKHWFTVAENEQMDNYITERMKGTKLDMKYELKS